MVPLPRQHSLTFIDAHLDLAYLAIGGRDLRQPPTDRTEACVTLPTIRSGGIELAFGTIFTAPDDPGPEGYPAEDRAAAEAAGLRQLAVYESLAAEREIRLVRSAADLEGDGLGLLILMEGADPIARPEDAGAWFDRGVRLVGLTWAAGTRYAGGNGSGGPLSAEGRDLVAALDAAGIAHDVSHLSDEAFEGVMRTARGPLVASHSNARALMKNENERHLTDEQIRAISERGGVIGLNLYTAFLAVDRRATIDDALDHVEHVAQVMGRRDGVGLGSDMDGGFGPKSLPEGLEGPEALHRLASGLSARGWSDSEVDGFRRGNWLRWTRELLA